MPLPEAPIKKSFFFITGQTMYSMGVGLPNPKIMTHSKEKVFSGPLYTSIVQVCIKEFNLI